MSRRWRVLALCASAGALGGCAAAVIGGAAAGGYYIGKDARPATRIAGDAALTATIKTRLIADPAIKAFDINVDTYESIVILRGRVEKAEQRGAAERIARGTSGVRGVRNELKLRAR
jgi:hyperosmotically inducible periplasmic protein